MAIQMEIQRNLLFLGIPSPRGTAFDPARGLRELEQREIECRCARYCKSKPGIDRRACPFRVNSRAIAIHRLYPLHNRGLKGREARPVARSLRAMQHPSFPLRDPSPSRRTRIRTYMYLIDAFRGSHAWMDSSVCVRVCVFSSQSEENRAMSSDFADFARHARCKHNRWTRYLCPEEVMRR